MQVGIDSFAAAFDENSRALNPADRLRQLVEQIEHADEVGLDAFGIGEHHRREFLDSAPAVILGAAAARTQRIRLTSAVTVLSAEDPVRAFQNFATLDLLSRGRAEMIVGRGSSIEAFPLFGFRLEDYDALFEEKLELLLTIREHEHVHWTGKYRAPLTGQGVYPRPMQESLPIWVGVGGTPKSFARAGALGLPLMVAIIGGEPRRFRPLIDLYRETGRRHGHSAEQLKVGVHMLGYVGRHHAGGGRHVLPRLRESDDGCRRGARVATHDACELRHAARPRRRAAGWQPERSSRQNPSAQ